MSTEEGDAAAAVAEDAAVAEGEEPIEEKAEPLAENATSERVASADLTDLEWYLGSSGGMRDAADPVDLNIPAQFVEQAAAVDDPPVIAVVDTGVDYASPALAPSMVDLSQYPGLMEDTGCGKYGIVGFVAAGNFAANVDEGDNLLSAVQQGSTVVVDSADTTGDTSWFSNYGKINTDVFSPGSSILATLPNDLSVYHPAIAKRYGEALVYEGFETAGSAGDAYDGDVGAYRRAHDGLHRVAPARLRRIRGGGVGIARLLERRQLS